jgi:UDP-N-acetylglucosamine transferase subunit ALG13
MIFATVGTDQPFDRMMKVIDEWARAHQRNDVFAQIGEGGWRPAHVPWVELLDPVAYKEKFASARLIVGHAGMGTILSALNQGKPILVMPKRASLGEHRNEHQLATARHLQAMGHISVAFDETELRQRLDDLDFLSARPRIGPYASDPLIRGLRSFIGARAQQ